MVPWVNKTLAQLLSHLKSFVYTKKCATHLPRQQSSVPFASCSLDFLLRTFFEPRKALSLWTSSICLQHGILSWSKLLPSCIDFPCVICVIFYIDLYVCMYVLSQIKFHRNLQLESIYQLRKILRLVRHLQDTENNHDSMLLWEFLLNYYFWVLIGASCSVYLNKRGCYLSSLYSQRYRPQSVSWIAFHV